MMGRSWGKTVLLVATIASQSCDAFLVHSCGRVGLPKTAVWTSSAFTAGSSSCGAINTRLSSCDMSRPDSHRATSCSPLMMAKMPKTGKGKGKTKAERMEYVQSMASKQKEEPPASTASIEEDARDEESEGETASPVFNVDKLKAETKTPFRKIRIFIYGAFGVSALIGGVTSFSQLAATLSEQPGSLELQKVLINLLVDSGVMAAAAFCYNFETSQQEGLEQVVADAREKRRRLDATKITGDTNAERVQQLRDLCVKVPGSGTGENLEGAKEAPVGILMDEAKQGFCVLAGGKEFIRDSMLAAMLAKNQIFPSLNLLVVPVNMSGAGASKGFGNTLSYEEEGYVAAPVDEARWQALMEEEFTAAERQGAATKSSGQDGIVLVVSRQGKVLRRGVGVPIWKTIRDDVDPPAKKEKD